MRMRTHLAISRTRTSADTAMHVNKSCIIAHALLALTLCGSWGSGALLCACGHASWRVGRTVCAVDGLTIAACAFAMRALGPPPMYSDGNFESTLLRAAATLVVPPLLTPAARLKIAAVANRIGWNVTRSAERMQMQTRLHTRFHTLTHPARSTRAPLPIQLTERHTVRCSRVARLTLCSTSRCRSRK
jgi:hypothetical protein